MYIKYISQFNACNTVCYNHWRASALEKQKERGNAETRKLQRTGGEKGSYALTLPVGWIRDMGLEKELEKGRNVELYVMQEDDRLTIYPKTLSLEAPSSRSECQIDVPRDVSLIEVRSKKEVDDAKTTPSGLTFKEAVDMLTREIVAAYLIGYNTIVLEGRICIGVREYLLDFVKERLFGLELFQTGSDLTILQMCIHNLDILQELRTVKKTTASTLEHLAKFISEEYYDEDLADFISYARNIISKHTFYIVRHLKAAADKPAIRKMLGLETGRDLLGARMMIRDMERISSHTLKITDMVKGLLTEDSSSRRQKNPIKTLGGDELLGFLAKGVQTAIQCFSKMMVVYPSSEGVDFNSVNRAVTDARREWEKLREHSKTMQTSVGDRSFSNLRIVAESVGRICEYTSDVGEVVLNLAVEKYITQKRQDGERQASEEPSLRLGRVPVGTDKKNPKK